MTSFTKVGEGFQQKADEYATYLGTVEGRLRVDLTARSIEEFLPVPRPTGPVRALDLGGGTGTIAVRLAQRDIQVTLLDSSNAMLEIAERTAREAEVIDRVVLQHGDITLAGKLLTGEQFLHPSAQPGGGGTKSCYPDGGLGDGRTKS